MQRTARAIVIQTVVLVVLLGAAALAATYWYKGQNYVQSKDAQVSVPMAQVGSLAVGVLTSWNVSVGTQVTAGQVLGTVQAAGAPAGSALDLTAPFAGTVLESDGVKGETVAPGAPLAWIGRMQDMGVTAYIKETAIRHVSAGQSVDVTVDAFPGTTFSGTVQQVGLASASTFSLLPSAPQSGDFTKVTARIPVQIRLTGFADNLLPGESATVRIHLH